MLIQTRVESSFSWTLPPGQAAGEERGRCGEGAEPIHEDPEGVRDLVGRGGLYSSTSQLNLSWEDGVGRRRRRRRRRRTVSVTVTSIESHKSAYVELKSGRLSAPGCVATNPTKVVTLS
jgi:hypothetical protein